MYLNWKDEAKTEEYPICRVGSKSIALDWEGCIENVFPAATASVSHEPWMALKVAPSASSWKISMMWTVVHFVCKQTIKMFI